MTFYELAKAALELGVIPALALFLVMAMYLQNRQLTRDRREMEVRLLESLGQVLSDYRELISRLYDKDNQHSSPVKSHENMQLERIDKKQVTRKR
jgi:hypothetical protein